MVSLLAEASRKEMCARTLSFKLGYWDARFDRAMPIPIAPTSSQILAHIQALPWAAARALDGDTSSLPRMASCGPQAAVCRE